MKNKKNNRGNPQSKSAKNPHSLRRGRNSEKSASKEHGAVHEGVIDASIKGFGFFVCKELKDDVFISAEQMNGAMHGDKVMVRIYRGSKGTKHNTEGCVTEIIERANLKIVGTFKKMPDGQSYVEPDNLKIARSILIAKGTEKTARDGDKVVIEPDFKRGTRVLCAGVLEVLGAPDDKNVDMLSIIRSYNLYETFPPGVEREANETPGTVSAADKNDRTDFTEDLVITIDGDDSRDFDDAVSLMLTDNGLYRLSVHIADVAHYVRAGSKLDNEALKRGTSVYFPDMVLPMLPKKLSNGICSLNEGEDRLTLSVIMDIDKKGRVRNYEIKEGVMRSAHRMTYSVVSKLLEGDTNLKKEYADVAPMLEHMRILASILLSKRVERGAIDFEVSESEVVLDEKTGKVTDIRKKPRLVAHRIIEEFMLAANETVAEHMCRLGTPFVYRAHENPPPEKLDSLENYLACLDISFSFSGESPSPKEFQNMLAAVPQNMSRAVNRVSLRAMSKATYEPKNIGHYGLAAGFYCHFTSPIRRYPDLIIHRIIKDYLKNGKKALSKYTEYCILAAKLSSERERLAEKAERDVDDLKKAEYMRGKIGERYKGIVSGVTEFGLFVELDNSVEGLIRTEKLPGYSYAFNPALLRLSNGSVTFKMGDELDIIVESVNMSRVLFALAEE